MDLVKLKKRLRKAHKSLTNWFNLTGAAILTAILLEPSLIEWLNTNDLSYILVVGNVILRFKTSSDLADK